MDHVVEEPRGRSTVFPYHGPYRTPPFFDNLRDPPCFSANPLVKRAFCDKSFLQKSSHILRSSLAIPIFCKKCDTIKAAQGDRLPGEERKKIMAKSFAELAAETGVSAKKLRALHRKHIRANGGVIGKDTPGRGKTYAQKDFAKIAANVRSMLAADKADSE